MLCKIMSNCLFIAANTWFLPERQQGICPRCQTQHETLNRVFRYCPISRDIWFQFLGNQVNNIFTEPDNIED